MGKRPGVAVAFGLALLAGLLVALPSRRGPQPLRAFVQAPPATPLEDGARPAPLIVELSGPAARLDRVGKTLSAGVRLEPAARGTWVWESDRRLVFTPADDWPVGRGYRVSLDPSALAPGARLASRETAFRTAAFEASFVSGEFYVDPNDAAIKRVSAALRFSHPVDQDDLEKRLSLEVKQAGQDRGRRLKFRVKLDKLGGKAFVTSEPLEVPEKEAEARFRLAAGARSWRGGAGTPAALELPVVVPGRYSLLTIQGARVDIARDENDEPRQALIVEASAGVDDAPMAAAVSAWVLPPPPKGQWGWDAARIGPEVLALSTRAALSPLPSEHDHAAVHAFSLRAPPQSWLYVAVARGLEGYGGYALARGFALAQRVPEYPRRLSILHPGAVLSAGGKHALSLASEGVPRVRFELGRVLPGRVSLLASQSRGDFASPFFAGGGFGEDDLAERLEAFRSLPRAEPGRVDYFSFDFTPYLTGRHGLFFFLAESWDEKEKRGREPRDRRLILVTDLGLLVKDEAGGGHDVYVQVLSTGRPAAGARVEVLGRNGLPTVSAVTDVSGRAHFPDLSDFKREKQPVAYLARLGDDVSFLPYAREDRRLDYSRFDVGGVYTRGRRDRLEAYVFTDRGLYRPGETIRAAALVRSADWAPVPGTPLEAVVTDPRGLEVQKTKLALSTAAFEELSYATQENGLTGGYGLALYTVKDGRRAALLGSAEARVEEFLPDRLRIETRFSSRNEAGWVSPEGLRALVSLKTLYGTDAEGRQVSASVTLTPAAPPLPSFPGYRFFDPAAAKKSFSERLDDAVTDAHGEAAFALDLSRFGSATYRVTFSAEGFEAGAGRGVGAQSSIVVSPRPFLVGLKPDGDLHFVAKASTRAVSAIAVGPDGKASAAAALAVELVEVRHVSALVKQENGLLKYQSVERRVLVSSRAASWPAEGTSLPLFTRRPGDYELLVRDRDGLELERLAYSVAGAADLSRSLERDAELQVSLDKADYAPGEPIRVQVRAPYAGAGLLTIERDRVYAHEWFRAGTSASVQTIALPGNVEGNAYVAVQFLRALDSPRIYMSPLSYGVAPFTIDRGRRTLPLRLTAASAVRPGQTLSVRYQTAPGARVAVWIVDEGILQAADYRAPDPLGFFFRKRALEVRTYQFLDQLLPEASGRAPGGDKSAEALGRNLNPFKRKTDPPVAYWSGLFDARSGEGELRWTVPESFTGTLRVLAVAATPSALGVAQAATLARAPLAVLPSAPVFAAPGDEFELAVSVANGVAGSGPGARVSVAVEPSGHLQNAGPASVQLSVPEGREGVARLRLRARPALGSASARVTATLGGERTSRTVTLSVRPASPREATLTGGFLRPGGSARAATPRRLYPQHRLLEASVSPLPLALARGLLAYLEAYPHGCTEQLVSQAFPALVLAKRPGFGYAPAKAAAAVARAMSALRARQNAEGAFGYWAANSDYDAAVSVYAMHFLVDARDAGVPVAPEMLARGNGFLAALADEKEGYSAPPEVRAYALYLLTRQGRVTTDSLETLRRQVERDAPFKKGAGAAYMAAAYALLRLDALADRWNAGARPDDPRVVYLWARHFPEALRSMSEERWRDLARPLLANRFTTQDAAYSIVAFDAAASALAGGFEAAAAEEGPSGARALALRGEAFRSAELRPSAEAVTFRDEGSTALFYGAVQSGFDLEPPRERVRDKLEIFREYLDEAGKPVTSAPVGAELTVRLRLRALERPCARVAVVDLLPAGLEAAAVRGQAAAGAWQPDYVEFRDDRVVAYGTVGADSRDFTYKVRAVARGRFSAPPAYAEAMYDRSARARDLPSTFEVR